MSLIGEERKRVILGLLNTQGKVRTPELVEKLDVSSETVRRYLEELEYDNKLKRVYGGAIQVNFDREEPSYYNREVLRLDEKKRIGRAAADLVNDRDVIIIDDGTTALQMIDCLLVKRELTVLTVAVPVLTLLMDYKVKQRFDGEIIFIGGRVNAKHSRSSGALAQHFMESIHADKAFIVADGLQIDKGVTSYDEERGQLSRMFLKQSNQSIVMADHSKLGANHFYRIAGLDEVDIVISEAEPPAEWHEKLARRDVHWITAD